VRLHPVDQPPAPAGDQDLHPLQGRRQVPPRDRHLPSPPNGRESATRLTNFARDLGARLRVWPTTLQISQKGDWTYLRRRKKSIDHTRHWVSKASPRRVEITIYSHARASPRAPLSRSLVAEARQIRWRPLTRGVNLITTTATTRKRRERKVPRPVASSSTATT